MNIKPVTYTQYHSSAQGFLENKSSFRPLSFTSRVSFPGPIRVASPQTEQALNLYMSRVLESTIQTTQKHVADYFTPVFEKLMTSSKSEKGFYENLSAIVSDYISNGSFIKSNNRKNCYAERTMKMLEEQKLPDNAVYIDIGCGNGVVTKSVSDSLEIAKHNVYGLEVFNPTTTNGINVIKFDGNEIPNLVPNSDFVTLFTVLHHMKDEKQANKLLNSIYNNMNNQGYILIREHEVNSKQDEAFWKIVHDLNTAVLKRTSLDLNNGTLYKSSNEWEAKLQDIGFKFIKKWYDLNYNNQCSYFLLVQK